MINNKAKKATIVPQIEAFHHLHTVGLGALSGLYTLIVFLPGLAVSVRRLHDTGHSGWYYLLTFIPILGSLFLLYFFASDSAPEENRYGKSPKYAQETF